MKKPLKNEEVEKILAIAKKERNAPTKQPPGLVNKKQWIPKK